MLTASGPLPWIKSHVIAQVGGGAVVGVESDRLGRLLSSSRWTESPESSSLVTFVLSLSKLNQTLDLQMLFSVVLRTNDEPC